MRIAFVSVMAGSPWAASEVLWAEAAERALREGHRVLISTLAWPERPPAIRRLEELGAELDLRPLSRWYRRSSVLTHLQGSFRPLRRFKPDVICISQGGTYDISRSGSNSILRGLLRRLPTPYILLCHCEQPAPHERIARRTREVFRSAAVVGMVADNLHSLSENHLGLSLGNTRTFHNPVNLPRIEYLAWPSPATPLRLAFVGRLDPVKNLDTLIEALASSHLKSRDWTLTVYGAGPNRKMLQNQVAREALTDRIHFAGYVNDIAALWAAHHVLVMPSRFEGVPLAMIEAMLCGRPVVATNIGGISEWIEDGHNGFLISHPTTNNVAQAIERLWTHREGLEAMGRHAHERTLAKRDPSPARTLLHWLVNAAEGHAATNSMDEPSKTQDAEPMPSGQARHSRRTRNHSGRPKISVVIPTFEPESFLTDAVRSVLAQDPGREEMQIAIVDDGSKQRRAADFVASVAPLGRIEIHENTENVGLAGNWNRAITIARGDFIHILHQDDVVQPGFYDRLVTGLASSAAIGMAFSRHAYVDEHGNVERISHRERWQPGILSQWLDRIAESQRIQCPAAIVKRETYERLGNFRSDLRYALDWEMWVRIAAHYGVWYEPRVLASYRRHQSAETARLEAAGQINIDLMNAIEVLGTHLPEADRAVLKCRAYRRLARSQLRRAAKLLNSNLPQHAYDQLRSARNAVEKLPAELANRWTLSKIEKLETRARAQLKAA